MAVSHVKSVTVADFTGTVTVYNSQGSTETVNATALVRPSDWNSIHNQFLTLAGNTAGQSTVSGPNIVWAGGNNVTLSANGSTVTVVGPAVPAQTAFVLSNSNGVSFGTNGSTVTATVATTYAASNHSHGNPSLALTNLSGTTASNSAGLTISLSAAAGGGGADGYNILAAGTQTATTAGTVAFVNSNGVSFGMSGSTQITASHNGLTTAALSNHSHAFATTTTGGASIVVGTSNSAGVTIGVPPYLTTAQPVGAYLTTARASNDAVGLNTAATQVTWTVNSSGISLNAGAYLTTAAQSNHSHGNPTLALTNLSGTTASASNGLTISLSAAAPGAGGGVALAAGTQTATSGTIVFANSNGVTFGMSGSSQITASAAGGGGGGAAVGVSTMGDTAGNTATFNTGTVLFAGSNSLTISQQTGANGATVWLQPPVSQLTAGANITLSTAGSTISIIGPSPGGGAAPDRYFKEIILGERFTTIANFSQTNWSNRILFMPFWLDGTGLAPNTVRLMVTGIASSNRSLGGTIQVGLYQQTNGTQLTYRTSDSMSFSITASSQSTVWNGFRALDFTRLSGYTLTDQGRYVLAVLKSMVSNDATWANMAIYGADPFPVFSGGLGYATSTATNSQSQIVPFWGGYSATTGGFPNSIAQTQINGHVSASLLDIYGVIKEI